MFRALYCYNYYFRVRRANIILLKRVNKNTSRAVLTRGHIF